MNDFTVKVESTVTTEVAVDVQSAKGQGRRQSPELHAGFFSKAMFTWFNPLFKLSRLKRRQGEELEEEDLWLLLPGDTTKHQSAVFEAAWAKANTGPHTTENDAYNALVHTLWGMYKHDYKIGALWKFLSTLCQLGTPVLLNLILKYIGTVFTQEQDTEFASGVEDPVGEWEGYIYVAILAVLLVGDSIFMQAFFHCQSRSQWQARTTVTSAVYRKSLRLSSASRQTATTGEIVNYMQLDASRIEGFFLQRCVVPLLLWLLSLMRLFACPSLQLSICLCVYLCICLSVWYLYLSVSLRMKLTISVLNSLSLAQHSQFLWDAAFQIVVYLIMLYYYIGWATFAGLGAMFAVAPIIALAFSVVGRSFQKIAEVADKRINATNEMLMGMEGVKMAAWEESFVAKIEALRLEELAILKTIQYTFAFGGAVMEAAPAIVCTT
jgi:ABC-type multidrug transport system fused ATPase/permease subunit